MGTRAAVVVAFATVFAGCTILTDLDGFDKGDAASAPTSEGGPLPDGSGPSSSSASSSASSSTSSSSGTAPDAAPDSPPTGDCTVTTTAALTPGGLTTTGNGPDWVTPINAKLEDSVATTVSLTGSVGESRYLLASSFGFAVPATAEIRGVTVTIRAKATASTEPKDVRDEVLRLAPNGALAGSSVIGQQERWESTYSAHTAGGPTNTWGLALTPAIVNAPSFGVGYLTKFHANVAADTASLDVDVVRVAITYCN